MQKSKGIPKWVTSPLQRKPKTDRHGWTWSMDESGNLYSVRDVSALVVGVLDIDQNGQEIWDCTINTVERADDGIIESFEALYTIITGTRADCIKAMKSYQRKIDARRGSE